MNANTAISKLTIEDWKQLQFLCNRRALDHELKGEIGAMLEQSARANKIAAIVVQLELEKEMERLENDNNSDK